MCRKCVNESARLRFSSVPTAVRLVANPDALITRRTKERCLNTLLNAVIEAHGGLTRWLQFSDLVTDVDVRGRLCERLKWSGMVPQSRVLLSLRSQRTVILLPDGQGRIVVQPSLVSQSNEAGMLGRSLVAPREALLRESDGEGNMLGTAYLMGTEIRLTVTAPFLYTLPGVTVEEVAPRWEQGEYWRGLQIEFSSDFGVPLFQQVAHYGADGLLRRLRSRTAVLGNLDLVEYVLSYDQVDDIWIPTSKHVFACDPVTGEKADVERLGSIRLRNTFFTD